MLTNQCSYRRLLSNYQTWLVATALLSRTYHSRPSSPHQPFSVRMKIKDRRSALISARPEERHIDRYAREEFTNALHDMLKHKGVNGLTNRGDTYISVRELLSYRHFRMLSFPNLQKVVKEDRLHRFELLYQSLKGDTDSWWIRVKEGKEKDTRLDPIIFSDNIGPAIYGTTLEDWRSYISRKGISRRNDNYIKISREVPVQDYLTSSAMPTQVLIHIDIKHAVHMGIRFFLSSRPSPFSAPPIPSLHNSPRSGRGASSLAAHPSTTHPSRTTHSDHEIPPPSPTAHTYINRSTQILTPGNEFGFLPPECFTRVEVVRVKRRVLWPFEEQAGGAVEQEQSDKKEEGAILESAGGVMKYMTVGTRPERGYRTDYVEVTERDLDQFFIDLPVDHQARVVHPDLKKEALAVFSI